MAEPFSASKLKIARARRHIEELRNEIKAYFDRKGIVLRNEIDRSVTPYSLHAWVVRINEPQPSELPAMAGDVIHNLRAALDLLACDILRRVAPNAKLKGVSFPFSRADNDLDRAIKESGMRRAGPEAVRLLKELKPYKSGNAALRAVHDLDIQDKHTGLLLVAQGGTSPGAQVQFFPGSGITPIPQIQSKVTGDGQRFMLTIPIPGLEPGVEIPARFHFFFGFDGNPFEGREIIQALEMFAGEVEIAVNSFMAWYDATSPADTASDAAR